MVLLRAQKEELVENLKTWLKSHVVIVVSFTGLKVKDISQLRKDLFAKNSDFKMVKNTLLKRALPSEYDIPEELFTKPLAIIYGKGDEIEVCKTLEQFAKGKEQMEILQGWIDEKPILKEEIIQLALLPPKEMVFGRLVGAIGAPIYRLHWALKGNLNSLVSILKQYQEQVE